MIEENAQEQIEDQDDDERIDERVGRRPADAFGPRIAMEAAMATDEGDGRAEKQAFEHARKQIEIADELLRVRPVMMPVDAQQLTL